jgi:hypothetical protein
MAWLCLRNDDYHHNSQMVIVTGPNQELAIKLIKRMKALFEPHKITFDSKEAVLELNGCNIEAYPSNHIDAFRSLTNPKFILVDEGDYFRKNEQNDVRHVAERYIAKSDPFIVLEYITRIRYYPFPVIKRIEHYSVISNVNCVISTVVIPFCDCH